MFGTVFDEYAASHWPLRLAAVIAANPAAVILPAWINCSAVSLLRLDQMLLCLRGEKRRRNRSASRRCILLSIHPKHKASSTASGYFTPSFSDVFF